MFFLSIIYLLLWICRDNTCKTSKMITAVVQIDSCFVLNTVFIFHLSSHHVWLLHNIIYTSACSDLKKSCLLACHPQRACQLISVGYANIPMRADWRVNQCPFHHVAFASVTLLGAAFCHYYSGFYDYKSPWVLNMFASGKCCFMGESFGLVCFQAPWLHFLIIPNSWDICQLPLSCLLMLLKRGDSLGRWTADSSQESTSLSHTYTSAHISKQ